MERGHELRQDTFIADGLTVVWSCGPFTPIDATHQLTSSCHFVHAPVEPFIDVEKGKMRWVSPANKQHVICATFECLATYLAVPSKFGKCVNSPSLLRRSLFRTVRNITGEGRPPVPAVVDFIPLALITPNQQVIITPIYRLSTSAKSTTLQIFLAPLLNVPCHRLAVRALRAGQVMYRLRTVNTHLTKIDRS